MVGGMIPEISIEVMKIPSSSPKDENLNGLSF
jgi:hypothetical protein